MRPRIREKPRGARRDDALHADGAARKARLRLRSATCTQTNELAGAVACSHPRMLCHWITGHPRGTACADVQLCHLITLCEMSRYGSDINNVQVSTCVAPKGAMLAHVSTRHSYDKEKRSMYTCIIMLVRASCTQRIQDRAPVDINKQARECTPVIGFAVPRGGRIAHASKRSRL